MSLCRQEFHEECETAINKQINLELYAMYSYLSMAAHFDRDDVALKGFKKFFEKSSVEEREHANKLIDYQNKRGGRVVLQDIKKPERDEWGTGLEAMQAALELEKQVNKSLMELHEVAENYGDAQMTDFIEGEYLKEQVEASKQLADFVTKLQRMGSGVGEFLFDKKLLEEDY